MYLLFTDVYMSLVLDEIKTTPQWKKAEMLAAPLIMKRATRLKELKKFSDNDQCMSDDEVDAFLRSIRDERNESATQHLNLFAS